MKSNFIAEVACLLLIGLFGYAAVSKLTDYGTFKLQLGQSPFIEASASVLAWAVPAINFLAAAFRVFARPVGRTFLLSILPIYL